MENFPISISHFFEKFMTKKSTQQQLKIKNKVNKLDFMTNLSPSVLGLFIRNKNTLTIHNSPLKSGTTNEKKKKEEHRLCLAYNNPFQNPPQRSKYLHTSSQIKYGDGF